MASLVKRFDGKRCFGPIAGRYAMQSAICMAKEWGLGVSLVTNCHRTFCMAPFAELASNEGLIGFAYSQTPAFVRYWGSRDPFLGSNAISVSMPGKTGSITFDMSFAECSMGEVLLCEKLGLDIPPGKAFDSSGKPTTKPQDVLDGGFLEVFGGYKGSILSLFLGFITQQLSKSALFPKDVFECGHVFAALNPEIFCPLEEFKQQVNSLTEAVRNLSPAANFEEVKLPGDRTHKTKQRSLQEGISMPKPIWDKACQLAKRLDIHKASLRY